MTAMTADHTDTGPADLPFIDELRSATALSRRLGFAVRPRRIRVKPGRSAIVAWQRDGDGHLGELSDWGFTAVMTSPDKLANAQRRAARHGQELTVHEAADPHSAGAAGAVLLSGGVLADPRIGKHVARALEHLGGDVEIIGYNPARRLLLKHTPIDGAPEFVRIDAGSQRHLAEAAARWHRAELPSLPVRFVGGRATATRSPWWGTGDLHEHPNPDVAEEVGAIIAERHRGVPGEASGRDSASGAEANGRAVGPADRCVDDPVAQAETAARGIARLLPERAADVAELGAGLRRRLGQTQTLREIHGDLSPDQVLLGHSECRIIDLDRAGIGPIGMDLGRWVAACRSDDELRDLEQPFLDGYRSAGGVAADLGAWTAWALLIGALEPWRCCCTTWKGETMRIIDAAIDALGDGASDDATAADRDAGLRVPDTITIDGQDWTVRRAWPAGETRIAWEAVRAGQGIRVGNLDERGSKTFDAGRDPKLPGLEGFVQEGGRLVSHRPGKRAVVRLPDDSFAKCVRDGRARDILAGQRRAAGFMPGFALPQVLRSDSSTVVLSALPGVELHDPATLGADWSRAWAEALAAWTQAMPSLGAVTASVATMNDASSSFPTTSTMPSAPPTVDAIAPPLPEAMPIHDAAAEADVLRTWRDRARPVFADVPGTRTGTLLTEVDYLIDEVTADLNAEDTGRLKGGATSAGNGSIGLIHRDLHDKQIMWDPTAGPGLLDVDTACLGERAIDLGNLRAHARWRTEQGLWTSAEAAAVIAEIGRAASAAGIDPERVSAYERATLVRLACVYAFRPAWRERIGRLLEAARSLRG